MLVPLTKPILMAEILSTIASEANMELRFLDTATQLIRLLYHSPFRKFISDV